MTAFKAYDIRGLFGSEVTKELAYKLGRAFVQLLKCKEVIIGHDMRESCKVLLPELVKGITEQGANVLNIGLATTPLFCYACNNKPGIMITASHNPAKYNGFKLIDNKGNQIYVEHYMQELRKLVENNNFEKSSKKGKEIPHTVIDEYITHFVKKGKGIKKYKIVFDAGNGMGGLTHPIVYKKWGCEVIPLFIEPDGRFPNHEPNPMKKENRESARKAVLSNKADLAILTDGDADRIMFLDEKGNLIPPDFLIALLAQELLQEHPGAGFVYDLRCSKIVKETIEAKGGKSYECRVGNPFLKKMMREKKAIFAGELSAHFMYKETQYHESSIYTALLVLKLMSKTGKKLSELIAPLCKYAKIEEESFEVSNKEKVIENIAKHFCNGDISREDGIKITFPNWWLSIRASNTEPLIRLNIEADTPKILEKRKNEVIAIIRK